MLTSTPSPKTPEEHRTFLHELARVQLVFLWHWLRARPHEDFIWALRGRVDLFRRTNENPGDANAVDLRFEQRGWPALEERLRAAWSATGTGAADAPAWEQAAHGILAGSIDARADRDFAERPYVRGYNCGSLHLDPASCASPHQAMFHIANAIAPRSPLSDPHHLRDCLRQVLQRARATPGLRFVSSHSWLNSHPAWLRHLPPAWRARAACAPAAEVEWHYGHWGQLVDSRGLLNQDTAAAVRQTGRLPHPSRLAYCSLDELASFLDHV